MDHGSHEHSTQTPSDDECPDECGVVGGNVDNQACDSPAAPKQGRCVRKVKYFNRFIDDALAGLPPSAALLWLTLFRYAKNGIARVSQGKLAERMGVDVKTVGRNLRILLGKNEMIRVVKQGSKGRGCSVYQLGIIPLEPRAKPNRRKQPPR
jgi:hypothetical protein